MVKNLDRNVKMSLEINTIAKPRISKYYFLQIIAKLLLERQKEIEYRSLLQRLGSRNQPSTKMPSKEIFNMYIFKFLITIDCGSF